MKNSSVSGLLTIALLGSMLTTTAGAATPVESAATKTVAAEAENFHAFVVPFYRLFLLYLKYKAILFLANQIIPA